MKAKIILLASLLLFTVAISDIYLFIEAAKDKNIEKMIIYSVMFLINTALIAVNLDNYIDIKKEK